MDLFLLLTIKLIIGFLALTLIINITGKGNLAPSSASDQIINYVLGGIIGGVIYNNKNNVTAKTLIDSKALTIIHEGINELLSNKIDN